MSSMFPLGSYDSIFPDIIPQLDQSPLEVKDRSTLTRHYSGQDENEIFHEVKRHEEAGHETGQQKPGEGREL